MFHLRRRLDLGRRACSAEKEQAVLLTSCPALFCQKSAARGWASRRSHWRRGEHRRWRATTTRCLSSALHWRFLSLKRSTKRRLRLSACSHCARCFCTAYNRGQAYMCCLATYVAPCRRVRGMPARLEALLAVPLSCASGRPRTAACTCYGGLLRHCRRATRHFASATTITTQTPEITRGTFRLPVAAGRAPRR
jgi:hypothetical protein